jgi:hypothetical protein
VGRYREAMSEAAASKNPVTFVYMSAYWLKKNIKKYSKIVDGFDNLPMHARVGVTTPPQRDAYEIFLPEVVLFENMAMLLNECLRMSRDPTGMADQFSLKRLRAGLHACYTTSLHFVEAYLNAIAYNFAYLHSDIREADYGLLLEYDLKKERHRNVGFRTKLIQYPRIITGAAHPPLTESNLPAMAVLLGVGKTYRDAIVHASPRPSEDHITEAVRAVDARAAAALREQEVRVVGKEWYLLETDLNVLTEVVDAVVEVVWKIEELIHGYMLERGYLARRGPDGMFPKETFK